MERKPLLKPLSKPAPLDTNLLSLMFQLARNNGLLLAFLNQIIFIREHPSLTEEQARRELNMQGLIVPKDIQ